MPTSVTATEAYQAMESGVVDTVAFAQHAHLSFGTINQADWWTANLNPGTVNCPVVVNIDAYECLSDAEREALDSSVDEALDHYLANYGELLKRWDAVLEEKGVEKVEIAEVLAEFRARPQPIRHATHGSLTWKPRACRVRSFMIWWSKRWPTPKLAAAKTKLSGGHCVRRHNNRPKRWALDARLMSYRGGGTRWQDRPLCWRIPAF